MDEYPPLSLDHNLPLLIALGFQRDHTAEDEAGPASDLERHGVAIRSKLPPLDSEHAVAVLKSFEARDGSGAPWGMREGSKRYHFQVQVSGRTLRLPPRKATLPEGYEEMQSPPLVLHSPFSPLSPASSLYPDGLIDSSWIRKHQTLLPSVLLCFYDLTSDSTVALPSDNQIKTDISAVRSAISQSGYKLRLAAVLLSDHDAHSGEGIQERVESIRKGSGLDTKACFLVPPQESQEELERIVENTLTTLYGQAIEYYRDLSRHARKKRGRGVAPQPTIPPTTGTSQTLGVTGWNVRYDFKSAVFAEFRQEMDLALKSYEQAYDNLLSTEVMEAIPSWSPRWNEARLLADIIAVRSMRCLLWNGQHSAAVRRWQSHRSRTIDIVERIGRGTQNYGWAAWEARWAVVMANMIERLDVPQFAPPTLDIWLQPEKTMVAERLQPWEFLHHTGYWYRLAAQHLYARRDFARAMPDDDRRPPGSSPASQVANRAFTYDTYMCPEPHEELALDGHSGVDHTEMILNLLRKAWLQFETRNQHRLTAELAMECAQSSAGSGDWQAVAALLTPLWESSYARRETWPDIAEAVGWLLRQAAIQTGQAELILAIDWELLGKQYSRRLDWHYDLSRSLEGLKSESRTLVKTEDATGLSPLEASLAFRADEGKAGENVPIQLTVKSNAMIGSKPIRISTLGIRFAGNLQGIKLSGQDGSAPSTVSEQRLVMTRVSLQADNAFAISQDESPAPDAGSLVGSAKLAISPGQILVLEMDVPLREPGDVSAESAIFVIRSENFELEHTVRLRKSSQGSFWHSSTRSRTRIARSNPHSIHILPRPPKLEITARDLFDEYYTDENIELRFEMRNAEAADARGRLDIIVFNEEPPVFEVEIGDHNHLNATEADADSTIASYELKQMIAGSVIPAKVRFGPLSRTTRLEVRVRMSYRLSTDPATLITQNALFHINVINPFEANYDLLPRLHPDPWPSYFDHGGVVHPSDEDIAKQHVGLAQRWSLVTRYASFASHNLRVTDVAIHVADFGGLQCTTRKLQPDNDEGLVIRPKTINEAAFDLTVQKRSLDDRGPSELDITFVIKWQRTSDPDSTPNSSPQPSNTTMLPVPPFTVFTTEPRVLATTASRIPSSATPQMLHLQITIENPSSHFLTFGLTMEPSDVFAFSGPKKTALHLLPLSRRVVTYRLLPLVHNVEDSSNSGVWIRPNLVVRDKYFQKTLRVLPTEGMRADKDGFLVWVPASHEEQAITES
jgi:trafficking protein particle complex subunit 11